MKLQKLGTRNVSDNLVLICSWCYPSYSLYPLLPKGKKGWTSGLCEYHFEIKMAELKQRKLLDIDK